MASLKSIIRQGKQTRSDLKQLRNSGKVPAVVYGYGTKNTSVKVDEVEFIKVIREVGRNGVIDLGEAVGAKEGGVVEQPLFNLEVTATPENIPETIEVDISELQVNDSLAVSDIKISGDFTIENNPEDSIVTVVPPTDEPSEEEVEAMEGESATEEPEVVGEDKEDDEEENKED